MLTAFFLLATTALADDGGFDHTHGAFDSVLDGAVSNAGVNYGTIAGRRAQLDAYLEDVANADVSGFSRNQKLAFYINAYNGYTLKLILDHPGIASIRDLNNGNPWDAEHFPVAGESLTLNDMEHRRVRQWGDARIHAAVNCASRGCPPLGPDAFTASGLDVQLDRAARRWVSTNAYQWSASSLQVSEIFTWYDEDFVKWAETRELPTADHQDTVAFLQAYGADFSGHPTTARELSIDALPYDWSLNKR